MADKYLVCGGIHAKVGAKIIAAVFVLLAGINILRLDEYEPMWTGTPMSSFFLFVSSWMLVYGAIFERRYYMLPDLILQATIICAIPIIFLLQIGLLIAYGDNPPEIVKYTLNDFLDSTFSWDGSTVNELLVLIAFMTASSLNICTFRIFFTYYCFLRDCENVFLQESQHSRMLFRQIIPL